MSHSNPAHYKKIWLILSGLLIVSIVGPTLEIRIVTLITAFGVALVKAYLVAKHFMHIPLESKWVSQLLLLSIALMVVLFFGIAPDVMKHQGQQWEHTSAIHLIEKAQSKPAEEHH
jgi:caa(3)-type oxidase subunit IV